MNDKKLIVCGMATVPYRIEGLQETINSIINQVDKLIIYQNDYKEIFDFLKNDKIEVLSSLDTNINMGDAGKFYKVEEYDDCYYFSIDDDIIYPSNYVESTIKELKKHNDNVIVTYHGKILNETAKSFYHDLMSAFHFKKEVTEDVFVHFGGTGVMAFSNKKFKFKFEIFQRPNIADIWVGIESKKQNMPILCLKHKENWIRNRELKDRMSIYSSCRNLPNFNHDLIDKFDKKNILKL